jgi:hypothetical protein
MPIKHSNKINSREKFAHALMEFMENYAEAVPASEVVDVLIGSAVLFGSNSYVDSEEEFEDFAIKLVKFYSEVSKDNLFEKGKKVEKSAKKLMQHK